MAYLKNTNLLPPVKGRLIRQDTVDSTNNYAMRCIDAASAGHGDIVLAGQQSQGKGQRGRSWYDTPGESLLMSLIVAPRIGLDAQPAFLAAVAVVVADVIAAYIRFGSPAIKWPNDILIGDKKAAGILIENVIRGASWEWAVIGIGLNVGQASFPEYLPHATSLNMQGGAHLSIESLAQEIAEAVFAACESLPEQGFDDVFAAYNSRLYQRDGLQSFKCGYDVIVRRVLDVTSSGKLRVRNQDGHTEELNHGSVEWIWR